MNNTEIQKAVQIASKRFGACFKKGLRTLRTTSTATNRSSSSSSSTSSLQGLKRMSKGQSQSSAIIPAARKPIAQGKCKPGYFEHPDNGRCYKRGARKEKELLRSSSSRRRHQHKADIRKARQDGNKKAKAGDAVRNAVAAALGRPLSEIASYKSTSASQNESRSSRSKDNLFW